jgi:cyclopropane fatty-acyl-phospholipid synthase-like methyltransferase
MKSQNFRFAKSLLPKPLLSLARAIYYRVYRLFVRCWCWYVGLWDEQEIRKEPFPHLPPPLLRFRTGETPSLEVFLAVGKKCSENIVRSLEQASKPLSSAQTILDFGCGCGRTLIWLSKEFPEKQFYGTDTDEDAISWCRENLDCARFTRNSALPPVEYDNQMFDIIFAVSVFTHLSEDFQFRWLREFQRILKPDGALLLTVHGKTVWEALDHEKIETIQQQGLLTTTSSKLEGIFPEWYQTTFHTRDYVLDRFGHYFPVVHYIPEGMGYQDVVICWNNEG